MDKATKLFLELEREINNEIIKKSLNIKINKNECIDTKNYHNLNLLNKKPTMTLENKNLSQSENLVKKKRGRPKSTDRSSYYIKEYRDKRTLLNKNLINKNIKKNKLSKKELSEQRLNNLSIGKKVKKFISHIKNFSKGPFHIFNKNFTGLEKCENQDEKILISYFFWKAMENSDKNNYRNIFLKKFHIKNYKKNLNTENEASNFLDAAETLKSLQNIKNPHDLDDISFKPEYLDSSYLKNIKTVRKNPYVLWLNKNIDQIYNIYKNMGNTKNEDEFIDKCALKLALDYGEKWNNLTLTVKKEWYDKVKEVYKLNFGRKKKSVYE